MKCQSGIRALCRILSRVCSEAHTVNGQQSIEACGLFHSACQKAFAPKFEHFGAAFALGPNSYQTRGVKTAVLDLKRGNVVMWNGKPASGELLG